MNLKLRKFRPGVDTTKPFDCSDADLNGFLVETSTGTTFPVKFPMPSAGLPILH